MPLSIRVDLSLSLALYASLLVGGCALRKYVEPGVAETTYSHRIDGVGVLLRGPTELHVGEETAYYLVVKNFSNEPLALCSWSGDIYLLANGQFVHNDIQIDWPSHNVDCATVLLPGDSVELRIPVGLREVAKSRSERTALVGWYQSHLHLDWTDVHEKSTGARAWRGLRIETPELPVLLIR